MIKILLINSNTETKPYPVPPLGICLLASYLKQKNLTQPDPLRHYNVKVYDGTFEKQPLADTITVFQPDLIGVGIRNIDDIIENGNFFITDIYNNYIKIVRRHSRAPLVLGGAGFSIFPLALMKKLEADAGIIGEGEKNFEAFASYAVQYGIDHKKSAEIKIPNLITREDVYCREKPQTDFLFSDESRILPGKENLYLVQSEIDTYIDFKGYSQRGSYPVQCKRGCIFRCIYCTYPCIEGNRYRIRPANEVADEIETTDKRLGNVTFEFVDSTFNSPPGYAEQICKEIIRRRLKIRLRTMGINPGGVTGELIELMKEAGFVQIDCTPDTASPSMLVAMKKNFNLAQLENTAKLLKIHNMPTMWFFIFGGPGETEKTIDETLGFAADYIEPLDMGHFTEGIRIYPGTHIREIAIHEGLIPADADLLEPVFYFSSGISRAVLKNKLMQFTGKYPNCLRACDSKPDPDLIKRAMLLRKANALEHEPMFRSLLRIRKHLMEINSTSC